MMPRISVPQRALLLPSSRARTSTAERRRARSPIARTLCSALCATLVGATVTAPVAATAAPLALSSLAPDEAPASVLGLDYEPKPKGSKESKESKESRTAARDMTLALRKAFANRGLSGGEEIDLEELRQTMGCSSDEVECLAAGGKALGVRRLVFGYLKPAGGGNYQLDIQILEVEAGQLTAQAAVAVSKAELAADQIDAKAAAVVNQLLPPEKVDSEIPDRPDPLPETDTTQDEPMEEPKPTKDGKVYFGLEKPTPGWKWGAFGTSLGLTVLAGGATIGMAVYLSAENIGFRKKLLAAANESLTDSNANNDIDPMSPETISLCDLARARPTDASGNPLGMEGQVRNSKVAKVCNDGDQVKNIQIGTGVGTAVAGLATLVFTGVLFIHRRKPAANAMLRHGVTLGVGRTSGGGLSVAGGMRF